MTFLTINISAALDNAPLLTFAALVALVFSIALATAWGAGRVLDRVGQCDREHGAPGDDYQELHGERI